MVDRARLALAKGDNGNSESFINDEVSRIQQIVATAAGLDPKRGDVINVTAVDFISYSDKDLTPIQTPIWKSLSRYLSSFLNGLVLVIAVLLILFLGVRLLMHEMREGQKALSAEENSLAGLEDMPALENQSDTNGKFGGIAWTKDDILDNLRSRMRVPPQNRLEQMVKIDEQRFAEVLREWVNDTMQLYSPHRFAK